MIDHARLAALQADIGTEDFADVVTMFIAEISERLARFREQPGSATADDFHFLRGCAANLGLAGMVAACQMAEHACRAGGQPDLSAVDAGFAAASGLLSAHLPASASAA